MEQKLFIYNSLTRQKEEFKPLHPPHVGMYVCGPTVYGEPHLGHARGTIVFDVLFRYLEHIGYKVRYVKNITDVGHLEDEVEGTGQDRISKRAKLEKLEPMEVVQKYKNLFGHVFEMFNVKPPSIEPQASGHIIEQIEMIKDILSAGYAYESNGSVYFDIEKYNKDHSYGQLSGRNIEDMLNNTRVLDGQGEKRNPLDFALWKKAMPEHLMRWPSPWSDGFPGWHLECSAMGTKYLGTTFDIHGGGMDLLFPHHECEIAQSVAANGKSHVKYWMHNNMITIDGQKMGKSLNNFINLRQFFTGDHERLNRAFSPMTIRFFMLQAHYRSTLDFSNDALEASEKGLQKLLQALDTLEKLVAKGNSQFDIKAFKITCFDALNDDLNTPILISRLFDTVKYINQVNDGKNTISEEDKTKLLQLFNLFVFDILGLKKEESADNQLVDKLIGFILEVRQESKQKKDYATSDKIRDSLTAMGITIKDTKEGSEWQLK